MRGVVRGLVWSGAGLVALVGAALAVGAALPVDHAATVSRVFPGTPDRVWADMTNVEGFPGWRADVDEVRVLVPLPSWSPDTDAPPTTVASTVPAWVESGPSGTLTFEVVTWEPPRRLVTRIADEGLPFGGTWTHELEAVTEDSTRVTLTEDGEIYNVFFRFVSRFILGYEGTMRTYLDGLEARRRSR